MQEEHQEVFEGTPEAPFDEVYSDANLFIRHLSRAVDEHELRKIFSPYGEIVSAAVMRNIHTGENLGTAFVRYATADQARAALQYCHGSLIHGRTISVHWAKKQHDDAPVGEARKQIFKLFVRNIPLDVTAGDLARLFSRFGPVGSVTLHKDTASVRDKRLERRIAFVAFLMEGVAEKAAEAIHNTRPFPSSGSIPLMVKLAEDLPSRSRRRSAAFADSCRKASASGEQTWCHADAATFVQQRPPMWPLMPLSSAHAMFSHFYGKEFFMQQQHHQYPASSPFPNDGRAYYRDNRHSMHPMRMPLWPCADRRFQQKFMYGQRQTPFGAAMRRGSQSSNVYVSPLATLNSPSSSLYSPELNASTSMTLRQSTSTSVRWGPPDVSAAAPPQKTPLSSYASIGSFHGTINSNNDLSLSDTTIMTKTLSSNGEKKHCTRYTHNPYRAQ